jgi:single-strand DNA-binding protein
MINQVTLVGRLSKAAELRYTTNGTAVASFTVACNRFGKDEADFINCVAFKKTAENLANYTDKGSLIGVTGSIQIRSYEIDSQKRWVTEVIANSVQFLDSKKKEEKPAQRYTHDPADPFKNSGQIDIDDDSLPF